MKKLVLFFAMATVVAFSACSNKAKEEPVQEPAQTEEPAPAPVQEEAPVDTTAVSAETPAE